MEKNLKIFLVDDEIFCLNLYQQMIHNLGFEDVSTFQNGYRCLEQLDQAPDVIFLDHHMHAIEGFDLLKKIKRRNPDLFVIILSGQESLQLAVDALKFGAFDYLVKGDQEEEKIGKVLQRIMEINRVEKQNKPSIIKKLLFL
ncbi:MAG: response regulator [Bacteroidota bacterium]